jgi:hypothetical protein
MCGAAGIVFVSVGVKLLFDEMMKWAWGIIH